MKTLDLDCDAPDEVPQILRNAAEVYRESESELSAAWQDKNAGKAWGKIAAELEKLADKIERKIELV